MNCCLMLLTRISVFQQFGNNVLWCGFLWVCSIWRLLRFVDMYIHVFYQIWEVFEQYFFKNIFLPLFCSLLLLGLLEYICWYVWQFSIGPLGPVHFPYLFCFCSSDWAVITGLFSNLMILFFSLLISAAECLLWILNFFIVLLSSVISTLIF